MDRLTCIIIGFCKTICKKYNFIIYESNYYITLLLRFLRTASESGFLKKIFCHVITMKQLSPFRQNFKQGLSYNWLLLVSSFKFKHLFLGFIDNWSIIAFEVFLCFLTLFLHDCTVCLFFALYLPGSYRGAYECGMQQGICCSARL